MTNCSGLTLEKLYSAIRVVMVFAVIAVVVALAFAPIGEVAYADAAVTVTDVKISKVTATNAYVEATAYKDRETYVDTCGIYLGTSEAGVTKQNTETVPDSSNGYRNLIMWYDLNDELHITLQPDTTYYLKFYCTVKGNEYSSDVVSFKTLADSGSNDSVKEHVEKQDVVREEVQAAVSQYKDKDGWVDSDDADAYLDAAYSSLKQSKTDEIANIGKNDSCVWADFRDGSTMICVPQVEGTSSMPVDQVCSIQTWEPCNNTYSSSVEPYVSMIGQAADVLDAQSTYWHNDVSLTNSQVTLAEVKKLGLNQGNEIIIWHGHGGYVDGKGEVLLIGELCSSQRRMSDKTYNDEYTSGNVLFSDDGKMFITSKFVNQYYNNLNGALVYLGACWSGYDSQLADAFRAGGAKTVIGFSNSVQTTYDCAFALDYMKALCSKKADGRYNTASEALDQAKGTQGSTDRDRYGGSGAFPKLFGDGDFRLDESLDDVYYAYLDKVQEAQARYGDHSVKKVNLEGGEVYLVAGVGYVNLIDFDGDGTEEMVMAYGDESKFGSSDMPYNAFTLEVWGYESGNAKLLHSVKPHDPSGGAAEAPDGIMFDIVQAKVAGKPSYIRSVKGDTTTYSTLEGGSFAAVDTTRVTWTGSTVEYYVNGSKVSESEYSRVEGKYFTSDFDFNNILMGDIPWNDDPYDFESELFMDTDNVIGRLMIGTTDAADEDYRDVNGYYEKTGARVVDPNDTGANGYILPKADTYEYSKDELSSLSDWGLCLARCEIPARHGLILEDRDIASYFEEKSWYNGTLTRKEFRSIAGILNATEEANVSTILEIETERGSQYRP